MAAATKEFDSINGHAPTWQGQESELHEFLKKHPNHIDALHHYARCLQYLGDDLTAFAFSQTAVATGMRAFPAAFVIGKDRLDTSWVENRPFLRALHGLMISQRNIGLIEESIATGEMCLALDRQDRFGAREELVASLIECHRDKAALSLFENPKYNDTFFTNGYLHPFVLIRLGREEEARKVLRPKLNYQPHVGRFLLDKNLPEPKNDSTLGFVTSGSEYEGWAIASSLGRFWRRNPKAMKILREETQPYEQRGWKRWSDPKSPPAS